jgi:hypothetical protein
LLRPKSSRLIGPHKSSIAGTKQKLCVNEGTKQRIARSAVEAPQALCLRRGQPQSRHLDVLALNASEYLIERLLCWHRRISRSNREN